MLFILFVFQGNEHYRRKVGISGGQGNKLFQWNDRDGSEKGKKLMIHDMNESTSFHIKEADLAMGDITRTSIRETAVDFSFPYFVTRVGYFTRKPYPLPRIMSILWPFKEFLWLCLAVTLPIFSVTYWIMSKFQPGHQNLVLQDLVTHVMMIFLYQSKLKISDLQNYRSLDYNSFQTCPIGHHFGIQE